MAIRLATRSDLPARRFALVLLVALSLSPPAPAQADVAGSGLAIYPSFEFVALLYGAMATSAAGLLCDAVIGYEVARSGGVRVGWPIAGSVLWTFNVALAIWIGSAGGFTSHEFGAIEWTYFLGSTISLALSFWALFRPHVDRAPTRSGRLTRTDRGLGLVWAEHPPELDPAFLSVVAGSLECCPR